MKVKKFNEEVFFSDIEIVELNLEDIETLKQKALKNKRKRVRVCSHYSIEDKLHEMFIVHTKDTYVRPHKHLGKSESMYVIEGTAEVVIYNDTGDVTEVIKVGDYKSGHTFYYRLSTPLYHNLIIKSDFFVFHEVTNGPFESDGIVFAPWAQEKL